MARPTKHYGKWRIRWVDANGQRQSEVLDDRREAGFQLQQHELEAEERRRGLKTAPAAPKPFTDLADYWEKHRVPQKRSGHHDESILRKHLRPAFGGVMLDNPAVWIELVDRYVVERVHLNKKTIVNHLTLLVTMLSVAVDLGWPRWHGSDVTTGQARRETSFSGNTLTRWRCSERTDAAA